MADAEAKRMEAHKVLETSWNFIYRANSRDEQQWITIPSLPIFLSINILLDSLESIVSLSLRICEEREIRFLTTKSES
jgi:hypothetical protein